MELRPLSIGELLDVAIKVTTRNARTFLMIVLVVVAPLQILQVSITASMAPELLQFDSTDTTVDADTAIAGGVATVLVSVVVFLLSTAACFKAVSDAYQGTQPDWRASVRFALRKSPALSVLMILMFLFLMLAFLALIIPGIWLGVAWSVAIPVLLIEGRRGIGALRRSFELVRGRWWQAAAAIFVGFLLAGILGGIIQGVLQIAPALLFDDNVAVNAVATAASTIVSALITTPFQAAIVTLLYFDLRVRKEGLDLELLAQRIGGDATAAPADAQPAGSWAAPAPSPLLATPQYTEAERAQAPFWPPPPGWKPEPEPDHGPAPEREPAPSADAPATRWLPPQGSSSADDG